MNAISAKPLAALLLALVAGFAQASTVTFTTAKANHQKTYSDSSDGYKFASSFLGFSVGTIDLTGSALKEGAFDTLTVSSLAGSAFDLSSLDIDSLLNLGHGSSNLVLLSYTEADGQKGSETLKLDGKSGLQTFSSQLSDLKSFSLTSVFGFTLDNVVLSAYEAPTPPAAPVPEPGTLGLMAAGLALLGVTLRRRTRG